MVRPERFSELMDTPAHEIFAVIVDRYGTKLADEIAAEILKKQPRPQVVWPRF
jgi:hypothetical protein